MRAGTATSASDDVRFPLRIRHLLVAGLLWVAAQSCLPRLRAAWQLPTLATGLADYALCMVGPTGPSLIRDNPREFWRLVRRRLIAAGADDHPFAGCAKAAAEVTGSAAARRAHEAAAEGFAEYGRHAPTTPGLLRLSELSVSTHHLAEVSDAAWPFSRGGYANLVKASAFAPEAPHPVATPRPGVGRGLSPARTLGRCTNEDSRSFVLGVSPDRRTKIVRSVAGDDVVSEAPFAPPEARVFAVSCDQNDVVIGFGREGSRAVSIDVCHYGGACAAMPSPHGGSGGAAVEYPIDVARVDGITVVAATSGGIVRVASSRDDGKSWTPFTVVFDAAEYPDLRFDVPVPDRLLVEGHRVELAGAGRKASATYPLLVSDDGGASFRAP
jgi:hypothetical protein